MKKIYCLILIALLNGFAAAGIASDTVPFYVGEQLVFDVYLGFMKVGDATMTLTEVVELDGKSAYHIILENKTTEAYSKIFKVDDRFETFLDTQTLLPLKFIKILNEGSYSTHKVTVFDHAKKNASLTSIQKNKTTAFEIKPDTLDTISIFYRLRVDPITVGSKLKYNLTSDAKVYDVEIKALRKVKKSIYGGRTYETVQMVPKASHKGDLFSKGKGWIWMSDNRFQWPVAFRAKLPFGSITFALIDVRNIYEKTENDTTAFVPAKEL